MIFGVNEEELISKSFGLSVKMLILPVFALLIIGGLFIFVVVNSLDRMKIDRDDLVVAREQEQLLQGKLTILQKANVSVDEQTSVASVAMPSKNPSISVLSQLKSTAQDFGVILLESSIKSPVKNERIFKTELRVNILAASIDDINEFVKNIQNISPVTSLDKYSVSENFQTGEASSEVVIGVYWADFPVKISDLTEPITGLTPDEEKLVSELSQLRRPEVIVLDPMAPEQGRDPFN